MNILMLSFSWLPRGGAGILCSGLATGLRQRGHAVRLWARDRDGGAKSLNRRGTTRAARLLTTLGVHRDRAQVLSYLLPYHRDVAWADLIHCHNLHGGFFSLPVLKPLSRRKPVVWTLHDFDGVWGGCDFPLSCQRWRDGCHDCPQLNGIHLEGSSPVEGLRIRRRLREELRITSVAVSRWMEQQLKQDEQFRRLPLELIPNGIDVDTFRPEAARSRRELGLPESQRLVVFAASNLRAHWKGTSVAVEAFTRLNCRDDVVVVLLGPQAEAALASMGSVRSPTAIALGRIDDRPGLAAYFAAADVVVVPSLQETFGLIASEAMACGTPVAAFAHTAVAEQIIDGATGCLAPEFDAVSLAAAIDRAILLGRAPGVADRCRNHVASHYSLAKCIARYESLYQRLVGA